MTKPNSSEPLKDEQTARFRTILKGDEDEATDARARTFPLHSGPSAACC